MPLIPHQRWLLLSDIHFRLRDLERTRRTAEWIVSLTRQTPGISRVVVCGDVLTSRSMQPTAVISAVYRFLSDLSHSVPHVNVILGNHDLAYRRDYGTTALEALNMSRLRPFISLHDEVGQYNWDGRRVLVLPFREDQTELTTAVAGLDPDEAALTVAFAHLAINRAVMQRHVVRDDGDDVGRSVRYRGLTGPDHFRTLARTFTGHFHSHQTILQSPPVSPEDLLNGSVTYLGAPLQLTWADLSDEDRGVVLLNPATLEHELIINPHAVGYVTVQGTEVLDNNVDASTVQGKHVMILGKLTRFQYWTARETLLSLGAQSVREPRPAPNLLHRSNSFAYNSLGASVPASDRDAALRSAESSDMLAESPQSTIDNQDESSEPDDLQSVAIDPIEYVREYVRSLEVEMMDEEKRIRLGERLILASESSASFGDGNAGYKTLLDSTYPIATQGDASFSAKQVFVAKPRSIVISSFLGVQDECTIDFDGNLGRGLTFVVGNNGSGKSTLIEAIVWCQFGRCIRKGLSVGDVVNDITGKDCMVSLSFSNGYTITRYRKHKVHGNRVVVSLYGIDQPQFEHGEARTTQAAIDELLGIDYEEFIKTVVLGHESAAGFLSSTPAQRHDLIESTLGLSRLDQCANLSRTMLREIDDDAASLRSRISTVEQTIFLIEDRITNRRKEMKRLRIEEKEAREASGQDKMSNHGFEGSRDHDASEEDLGISRRLEELKSEIKESQQAVDRAQSIVKEVEIWEDVATLESMSDRSIHEIQRRRQALRDEYRRLQSAQSDLMTTDHIHTFESTLRSLAQTISWLQLHASNTKDYLGPDSPVNRMALHFIRIGLMSLERLSNHLNNLLEQVKSSIARQQQTTDGTESAIKRIRTELSEEESNMKRLIKERDDAHTRVALDRGLAEEYVRSLSKKLSDTDVRGVRQQLSLSFGHLSKLLEEQGVLHGLQAKYQRKSIDMGEEAKNREASVKRLAKKEQEIATYQKLIEEETSMLNEQRSSHDAIRLEMESLMSTRELFAFWEESLSRRRTKSATASTFRGYVLDKSLQELNAVASKILLELYENTRHARELTKGMLSSIFAADPEYDCDQEGAQTPALLLDQTLGVTKTLAYAKRSGGERKRIDLAVFFALVQVAQAHGAHRARYMLVDEVFDSLDAAGQAAVVRWCSRLMTWTDFQLVVTHSDYLISAARGLADEQGDDDDDAGSRFSILSATMTKEGTKLSYNMA